MKLHITVEGPVLAQFPDSIGSEAVEGLGLLL